MDVSTVGTNQDIETKTKSVNVRYQKEIKLD